MQREKGADMNPIRCVSVLTALIVLGGLTPVWSQEKVLVPGNPPLTQQVVDLYREIWEWYCDVRLTPEQRSQCQQACIKYWKNRPVISFNQQAPIKYAELEKEWRAILQLKDAEQARKRAEVRERWMQTIRKENDELSRLLVSAYDAAHKTGGTKNAILVAGDPPLTQAMIDLDTAFVETILDVRLSEEQRQEYRRVFVEYWMGIDLNEKRQRAKNIESVAQLPTWSNYKRIEVRTVNQPRFLAWWAKAPDGCAQWLAAFHQSAYKPGGARNPVLVDGEPPLTLLVVDRYADYLVVMLDLSLSDGFTAPQRQTLQDYLVTDWKKMDAAAKEGFLADLKHWSQAAGRGAAEAGKYITAERPKLLARLSLAGDNPRSRWLLDLMTQERKRFELLTYIEQQKHATMMAIIGNIVPSSGHWEFNAAKGRYDWLP
jgi:hypothetical protein